MILGLTGGIASGKSTLAGWFGDLGAAVVSADQLAREAVAPGSPGLSRLVELFGADILKTDGTLNRERLGRQVFADPVARRRLEAITHPEIARLAEQRLGELQSRDAGLIVYEAPLLFEAGAEKRVDRVLVVLVDPDVQLERIMRRDGLDRAAAEARVNAQWSQADKVLRADYVIDNSGSPEQARRAVTALFHHLVS